MLYAVPAVLIVGSALFGCRPEERRLAAIIGIGALCAFIPCFAIAVWSDRDIARGFAYGLLVVGAAQLAMIFGRTRPSRGGGDEGWGEGGGNKPVLPMPPGPVDWPEFERRFWDEVERRPRRRPPSGSAERDRTPV